MSKVACALIAAALALPIGTVLGALELGSASAAGGLPHRAGPALIVWARAPAPGADLRCYVARPAAGVRGPIWLCG